MNGLRRKIVRALRSREMSWRYLFNPGPTLAYRLGRPRLSDEEERVAAEIEVRGIALSTIPKLFGSTELFDELGDAVREAETRSREEIARARQKADDPGAPGQKSFLFELLGLHPVLDPGSVFGRFAAASPFVRVANAYFGMYTRLRHYNVWRTLFSGGVARTSQLWHRDREDFRILKCFVYLSDVTGGQGPLTYVPGSHPAGPRREEPESFLEAGVLRSTDEQMEKVYPRDTWFSAVGAGGTVVFADTRGFHKGGLVRERDRVMFVSMFTSDASQSEELFHRPAGMRLPPDRAAAFALQSRGASWERIR
jgi:hypothetical protein